MYVLELVLDEVVASEPFGRLLLERARPITARLDAGWELVVAALARALDAPVLALAPGSRDAEILARGAGAFLGPDCVALLPAWEALPSEGISPTPEVAARRARAIRALRANRDGAFVLVAPATAAVQGIVPTLGENEPLFVRRGDTLSPDALAEQLTGLGYVRTDLVEHRGEFAVRGGIVDAFPGAGRRPVRAVYDGDQIESLRAFVPATQLTSNPIEVVELDAVRELQPTPELRARAEELAPRHLERFRDMLARFADGLLFEGMEGLAPLLFPHLPAPAELLPAGSWAVLARARRTADRARQAAEEAAALEAVSGWPGPPSLRRLEDALAGLTRLDLTEFAEGLDLGLRAWGTAAGSAPDVAARLVDLAGSGYRVVLSARGHGSLDRAREVVAERGLTVSETVEADLTEGFVFEPSKLAFATEEDLFGSRRHTRDAPRLASRRVDAVAEELEPGEFAVHRIHGVGRYVGVTRRAIGTAERDYLELEYAEGDRLFIPTDQVGMVAKYLGGEAPRVHRLGTNDWPRAKARVKKAVRDMAGELVRLYTVRMQVPGHPFGPDTPWQLELEDAFPFEETRDQLTTIEEVKRDMQSAKPMDRLICGDVGFGKTEIAVRAAFKSVMDGKQVAVLVPTTLLAEQHFVTFTERFAPFPVKVAMLSRFLSQREQDEVLEGVRSGKIDVVIGTHRLLSKDVSFPDLGLLVVDEEQRFGVGHKERIKRLRTAVDVLAMTATPIPRTLEMALTGIRDMSTVDTPPEDRQPVLTYVGAYDEPMAIGALRRELLREGQAFWVHNRVATIDRQTAWIREQLPEARVAVAHGQMDEARLESEMVRFWEREADVLVCTTIVESGLDVPSANTLIVDRADKLGLAQLYQIRGRVGRSAERAFAYLFFPPASRLTEEAHERLAAISYHTALGSGFQIALRDLEIRGAGDLLGAEQHGHIAAVGFDTYARLLRESVAELRGEPIREEREIRLDLPVKAFIPVGWVAQEALRLELYRRIATAPEHERLNEVREEAIDRFGLLPPEIESLFAVGSLRITCARLGVDEVSTFRDQVRVRPVALDAAAALELAMRIEGATYHVATATLNLRPHGVSGGELPGWIEERLLAATGETATVG